MAVDPYYRDAWCTLYHGDARQVLPALAAEGVVVDLVLTDPPYSSGGMMRSDRNLTTTQKYQYTGATEKARTFSGDNRDQRSLERWCAWWMADALALTKAGGAILSFIDWRNLPVAIDAVQMAGWVYRGLVPWDKTEMSRPSKGWFRSQCEYIVTGSNGPLARDHVNGGRSRDLRAGRGEAPRPPGERPRARHRKASADAARADRGTP